jgi:Ca2+-transporting ATPase
LTLLGVFGLQDPLRRDAAEAVKNCKDAGLSVIMVTGDAVDTASGIAKKCGILHPGGIVLEGSEFRRLASLPELSALDSRLPKLQVLARATPFDKKVLVERLQLLGEIVAVTGDGANDGPAMKAAHVSFSMGGPNGTEAARESSSIVLLNDDFRGIFKAIRWGRCVYESVQRFIQFQLTVNVGAVVVAAITAISEGSSVLRPLQLLWVNLIMDSLAALAFATDSPEGQDFLVKRPPLAPDSPLIPHGMRCMIAGQALIHILIILTIPYALPRHAGTASPTALTFRFNLFVFLQLFNQISCRQVRLKGNPFSGLFRNPVFLAIWIFTATIQSFIVLWGESIVGGESLSLEAWFFSTALGMISLISAWILRKSFIRLIPLWSASDPDGIIHRAPLHLSRERLRWGLAVGRISRTRKLHAALRRMQSSVL